MTGIDKDRWAEVKPLLDEAFDVADADRARWLEALARADPALAREVASYLAAEAAGDCSSVLPDAVPLAAPSLAGQTVGKYRLLRPIGHGGMGSVWLAERSDGRYAGQVAVKLLNLALVGRAGEERFAREGTLLARLTHPNIARLIDAGVTTGGQPYLVLEYVVGEPIDRYADRRELGTHERIALFLDVLAPVASAHANLIIHRDLKPSNIMVTADGGVKLLDFGIAKLLLEGRASAGQTTLTEEGGRAFTPEYAAPEVIRGEPVSTATDVYSLGVLLYLLLGGRHPIGDARTTPGELFRAIVDLDPPRLSDATRSRRLQRLYRGDLDTIVAKALKKDPSERYQTVTALADDLVRHLNDEPITARPDALGYRAAKFVRRNRLLVGAVAAVMVTLGAAAALTSREAAAARADRDRAVVERRRAESLQELQSLLLSEIGEKALTLRDLLQRGEQVIASSPADPALKSIVLSQLAERWGELGDGAAEAKLWTVAESLAVVAGDRTAVDCARGANDAERGDTASSRARITRARAAFAAERTVDPRLEASCLSAEAELAATENHMDSSLVYAKRAVDTLVRAGATRTLQYATALSRLAEALQANDRSEEQLDLLNRAAALLDSLGRGETISALAVINNQATAYQNLGDFYDAGRVLRHGVDLAVRIEPSGAPHPFVATNYALTLEVLGRFDSAAVWYRRAAERAAALKLEEISLPAEAGLARALAASGQLALARAQAAKVLRLVGRTSATAVRTNGIIDAWISRAAGDHRTALADLRSALDADGYSGGKRIPRMRRTLILASGEALALGDATGAERYAQDAIKATAKVTDQSAERRNGLLGDALLAVAEARMALGDSAGARTALERARRPLTNGFGPEHPRTLAAAALR